MRMLAGLILGLMVVGCGKGGEITIGQPPEATPTDQNTNKANGTTEKPTKELTKEDVVGTYEVKLYGNTYKQVFLENGVYEWHQDGKKVETEYTWSIVDGEIHLKYGEGIKHVWGINPDKSITMIAEIFDSKREEKPNEDPHWTYKKIK